MTNEKIYIHPTAEVNSTAKIGNNTKIWNNAQIREDAVIGENCNLGKNVYIDYDVKIGNYVKIENNVSVWNGVILEDDVFIGPDVCFATDKYPRSRIWTEDRKGSILVKKGASLGVNSTIIADVIIGEYAMVAAGSIVTKDVSAHVLVMGSPAKPYCYVCKCGFKCDIVKETNEEIYLTCTKCNEKFKLKK